MTKQWLSSPVRGPRRTQRKDGASLHSAIKGGLGLTRKPSWSEEYFYPTRALSRPEEQFLLTNTPQHAIPQLRALRSNSLRLIKWILTHTEHRILRFSGCWCFLFNSTSAQNYQCSTSPRVSTRYRIYLITREAVTLPCLRRIHE
jgi:hypothetical protein